jgi:branched-chain amino acid aminotransferase
MMKQEKVYSYGDKPGEISTKLYHRLLAIQTGDEVDKFGWVSIVD